MAKTVITMALGQLPEEVSAPFKGLYPELVHETPVTITIDPEKRSLDFIVGAREMSFGPSNENYSVFLLGCYRALTFAATKEGWMSQYQAQAEVQAAPAAPAPQPAAPEAMAPPAEAPKQASIKKAKRAASYTPKGFTPEEWEHSEFWEPEEFNSTTVSNPEEAWTRFISTKLEDYDETSGDIQSFVVNNLEDFFNESDFDRKEWFDFLLEDALDTVDSMDHYEGEEGYKPWESYTRMAKIKRAKKASIKKAGPLAAAAEVTLSDVAASRDRRLNETSDRLAAMQTKLASLPKTPEVLAFQAKLASMKTKVASTTVVPKPNHELFVRPLDFVAGLRADWQTWADQHGGKETMNEQGVLDLEVQAPTGKHQASILAEKSGWNHEAGLWTNPKGLQTANDSKLVAQLRKTAAWDTAPDTRENPTAIEEREKPEPSYANDPMFKDMGRATASTKIADASPNTPRAEEDHKGDAAYETALKEASKSKTAFEVGGSGVQKIVSALKAGKPAKVGNLSTDQGVVYLHNNPIFKYEGGKMFGSWAGWVTPTTARNVNGLAMLLGTNAGFQIKGGSPLCSGEQCPSDGWVELGVVQEHAASKTASVSPEEQELLNLLYPSGPDGDEYGIYEKNIPQHLRPFLRPLVKRNLIQYETDEKGKPFFMAMPTHEASKIATMNAWDVFLNGKKIDTVFDMETDPAEVKKSLVNHDGYDPEIVVKRGKKTGSNESIDGEAQLMGHTDNPVETLADGSTGQVEVDVETKVQEVATAKSASSLDFRAKEAGVAELEAKKFIGALTDHRFLGVPFTLEGLKKVLSPDEWESWKANWKGVVNYLGNSPTPYGFMKRDGNHWYAYNAEMMQDRDTRAASCKVARNCAAEPVEKFFASFSVKVECPAGTQVSGTDEQGNAWERTQSVDYGEIIGTDGGDGEGIDVFLGPDENASWVFVVNQTRKGEDGSEAPDEIKVGLGFWSMEEAKAAYVSMFDEGWSNFDPNIVTTTTEGFKDWMGTHPGAKEISVDDLALVNPEPEVVQPQAVVAPEVFSLFTNGPMTPYTASTESDITMSHQAEALVMFHDPAKLPMDHQAATLASLLSGHVASPIRDHKASNQNSHVALDVQMSSWAPDATSGVRIAEIITAELNIGYTPAECDHRAATVGYYGSDGPTFRRTLAKVAGITGTLVLQPNFIKNSCVKTQQVLSGTHKATRSRNAFHSVASTSGCADCQHCKKDSQGALKCALYSKPIVASIEEMHKIADTVWGKSSLPPTREALTERSILRLASKNDHVEFASAHTASVNFGDGAEDRPAPRALIAAQAVSISPKTYITSALSQGLTPSRIAEVLERSTTHPQAFKSAAIKELNSQKGLMGFLTIVPHFAGACSTTHGKHFAATASAKNKRKFAFHSVTKIAACADCKNCVKNASGERCSLYGKPLVATVKDLRIVAASVFPALAPKVAHMSLQELSEASLPYLAKALGIPEDHPTLAIMQPKQFEYDDKHELPSEKVPVDEPSVQEGASKNVMSIALQSGAPKTVDLEDITVKVKEAALTHKTPDAVYNAIKSKFAGVDKRDLKLLVTRIASDTFVTQSMDNTGQVYTEVSTADRTFGTQLAELAENKIKATDPSLSNNEVDLGEMTQQSDSTDEFDAITSYLV